MSKHVLVETNFLIGAFHIPHKRTKDAMALWERFELGEVSLHVPFLCFQEARNHISKSLVADLQKSFITVQEIRRHLTEVGAKTWDNSEATKFIGCRGPIPGPICS